MRKSNPVIAQIPDLDYPPFPGFTKAAFTFLKQIKKNNRREWLTPERKETYKHELAQPMRMLLAGLRTRLMDEGMDYRPDPARNLFRLYRDTRFSRDKRPFKTNIGAVVPYKDETNEGLGGYIHIQPGGCFYAGGSYMPGKDRLGLIRSAIDKDARPLRRIISDLEKDFGSLQGEKLKRSPATYTEDHPQIDLLRYKQMWSFQSFPDELAMEPGLVDWIAEATRKLDPLNSYLYKLFH